MTLRTHLARDLAIVASVALAACGGGNNNKSDALAPAAASAPASASVPAAASAPASASAPTAASTPVVPASLSLSVDSGVIPTASQIDVGPPIGSQAGNIGTPFTLSALAADPANTQNISVPFNSIGTVPDQAFGLCDYTKKPAVRVSYNPNNYKSVASVPGWPNPVTQLQMASMAPFYFPLTYTSNVTSAANTNGTAYPIIGLFDWRPKDMDEALVAAESDDNGKTWYWMQTVLELDPGNSVCPATVQGTNAAGTGENGWGHASIIQLPGTDAKAGGQMLYMLNRDPSKVDVAPLNVIQLTSVSNKFPISNTNSTAVGAQDINAISTALTNTSGSTVPVTVQQTKGLLNPDGILAVVPNTDPTKPTTILYVQKILNGDNTSTTAMPIANQCKKAPFSGKTNHDISNVRLATTMDGINFTDQGIVQGLNDPTTVDYNKTRWVSPRGTLIDVNGDGSRWGLLFSAGNCLDGDSDAFHYIGYAESSDLRNWTVYNDINSPIASINSVTATNQGGNQGSVTIPANKPLIPTQPWFAQRLYAPSAVQIDPTHLSVTFAGYAVQSPGTNLQNYRQIGNVVLTTSKALQNGPNNINNQ